MGKLKACGAAIATDFGRVAGAIGTQGHQLVGSVLTTKSTNRSRHGSGDIIVFNTEFCKHLKLAGLNVGHPTRERVVVEVQVSQEFRAAKVFGNGARQGIFSKVQESDFRQIKDTGRKWSRELIRGKVCSNQRLEIGKGIPNGTCKCILSDGKGFCRKVIVL